MRPIARAGPESANLRVRDTLPESLLVLGQLNDLTAELAGLAHPARADAQPRISELILQIAALGHDIHERITNSCAELQSVSAGLDSVLTLAEQQSEKAEEAYGLYCLLQLLKRQLDDAVGPVQRML
ncbi:DUF1484 family protein [Cupriavidus basilensis]|uniref:DUF1484 family protein n=1 Tax=Cupriavidus basilensis TaxID=68895 RepID=A0ABT6AJD2_9BURK|nr:DUF1484 family protein [Cupriavidus basilensis]MDF3832528.1 DUF1484 family protein [Cupriavidus basilensis]